MSSSKQAKLPIIIDTREHSGHAWDFDADTFSTISAKLDTGDYSVMGLERQLTLERKNLGDFVSSLIHDWTRFRKVLYRMAGMDCAAVVVEASVRDVLEHKYESDAEPLSVLGKANAITLDHGLAVVWAGDRQCAELWAARFLLLAAKKLGGV